MANLFFPQLLTGAITQYPIKKIKQFRTDINVYADGSVGLYPDTGAQRIGWELILGAVSSAELAAIQNLYFECGGPLLPFTFIDPTDNMLAESEDLTRTPWVLAAGCACTAGTDDPLGGSSAFTLTNTSQADAGLGQSLEVPANYQYCFSVYVRSTTSETVYLQVAGTSISQREHCSVGSTWTRVAWSGRLNDAGTKLTATIGATPGTSVQIFGPQLEAQYAASSYKPTNSRGGVYGNCHWTNQALPVTALGPNVFAVQCGIETSL